MNINMSLKKLLLPLLALSALTIMGCTHSIHMVHTDGFDGQMPTASKAKYIEARSEQKVVLWFADDTDYVEEAKNKLVKQCDGDIRAVSTQFSTSHGFLHWTNKILMKGVCVSS
ncbi:MAG: hypothetical protein V7785_21515 [Bermanella sp.]